MPQVPGDLAAGVLARAQAGASRLWQVEVGVLRRDSFGPQYEFLPHTEWTATRVRQQFAKAMVLHQGPVTALANSDIGLVSVDSEGRVVVQRATEYKEVGLLRRW